MLGGGCRVTRSPHRAVPRVSGSVPSRQESRHLGGAAAHWGSGTGRQRFIGVNFPFVTSGLLRIFSGRTCLPGDDSAASASPMGDRQSPVLAKTPSAFFEPTFYLEEEDRQKPQGWSRCWWGSVPAGPLCSGQEGARRRSGERARARWHGSHPSCAMATGPFTASPGVKKRRAFLLLSSRGGAGDSGEAGCWKGAAIARRVVAPRRWYPSPPAQVLLVRWGLSPLPTSLTWRTGRSPATAQCSGRQGSWSCGDL